MNRTHHEILRTTSLASKYFSQRYLCADGLLVCIFIPVLTPFVPEQFKFAEVAIKLRERVQQPVAATR